MPQLRHQPCSDCGSSDALTDYGDHTYCFSCGRRRGGASDASATKDKERNIMTQQLFMQEELEVVPLTQRGLSAATCAKFGVGVKAGTPPSLVFPYYDRSGLTLVAQKTKTPEKQFRFLGDGSSAGLFGAQLWRNDKGKRLVITEGELDAMSVSQAFGNSWPVVSIRNGAQGAAKDFKDNLEFIESFEEVVVWFDNDAPGKLAAEAVSQLLTPGKCKVVHLSPETGLKDANDVLRQSNGISALTRLVFDAKVIRPDGIVCGADIYDRVKRYRDNPNANMGYQISGFPLLNEKLRGMRKGKLYTIIAAPKLGKSTLAKELAFDLLMNHELSVASFAIEESIEETAMLFMGLHLGKRVLLAPKEACTDEEFDGAFKATVGNGRLYMFDHFGSIDPDNLYAKFRYMAVSLKVDFILFDHVSMVVSGLSQNETGESERRLIGIIETKLRQLIQETGVGVIQVAHIRKGDGKTKDPETGGRVSPSDVLGSGDIGRISDFLIAIEGDVASDTDTNRYIRVLYNRLSGDAGPADTVSYDRNTGRLMAVAATATGGANDDF